MSAKKFMKKPVEIEAWQFKHYSDGYDIWKWSEGAVYLIPDCAEHFMRKEREKDRATGHIHQESFMAPAYLVVKTLEGVLRADQGDWIVRGVQGEYYPVKPDIFEETYDLTESMDKK